MKRKEIKSRTIDQSNDASCIGDGNDAAPGRNKAAKRHSSRKLRRIIREEIKDYLNEVDDEDDPFAI